MNRNEHHSDLPLSAMGIVKWILITGLLAGLGLCYILCKNKNLQLEEQIMVLQQDSGVVQEKTRDARDGFVSQDR